MSHHKLSLPCRTWMAHMFNSTLVKLDMHLTHFNHCLHYWRTKNHFTVIKPYSQWLKHAYIYFLFWLNLSVCSNLIRKLNKSQYHEKLSKQLRLFSLSTKRSQWRKLFSFLTSTMQLSKLKIFVGSVERNQLLFAYFSLLGRIVCLNLTLVKMKT